MGMLSSRDQAYAAALRNVKLEPRAQSDEAIRKGTHRVRVRPVPTDLRKVAVKRAQGKSMYDRTRIIVRGGFKKTVQLSVPYEWHVGRTPFTIKD